MKLTKISTEDPILTAYALGELDASEAARVAALIAHDPAALQVVNEIRSTAAELQIALKDEPILSERRTPFEVAKSAKIIRFPYYVASAAAAACVAAVFGVRLAQHNHANAALVVGAKPAVTVATPAVDVATSNHLANVIPDGFSDLKPAPFRDSGYRLGKSIAASDAAGASNDTAGTSKIAPAPANSPSTSALASEDSASSDEVPHQLLSLKISPQVPVIDVAHQSDIPFVSPRALAFSTQEVKFTGLPDFRNLLKTPRGMPSDEVLSWSTPDLDKKEQPDHRTDLIELVKKPKNATVE